MITTTSFWGEQIGVRTLLLVGGESPALIYAGYRSCLCYGKSMLRQLYEKGSWETRSDTNSR